MTTEPDEDEDTRPLLELRRLVGGACWDCAIRYTAHEAVWNVALGFKDAPRCLPCMSRRLGRDAEELRSQVTDYVHRRDCYLRAWREADRLEAATASTTVPTVHVPTVTQEESPPISSTADDAWDAGDMGCGELVMQLRNRLNKLMPGIVFTVRATDPAAPEDIPAWCRLTGHPLVSAEHPVYRIRRREA